MLEDEQRERELKRRGITLELLQRKAPPPAVLREIGGGENGELAKEIWQTFFAWQAA